MNLTTCTHGAHKIHSGKTAKDLYLTTCTHGTHKIHSCKNKGVHTAKPFRVYRRGPWPHVQMRPLTACTDEAVTLATLAQNHPRVLATPESACTADPLTHFKGGFLTFGGICLNNHYDYRGLLIRGWYTSVRLFQHTFGTHPEQPFPTGYNGIPFIVGQGVCSRGVL